MRISLILLLVSLLLFTQSCMRHPVGGTRISNHFGIPYLDWSQDTSRQFVVARSAGIYYGHPTTVSTTDNSNKRVLIATYPIGGHARGQAAISVSGDGGKTWSRLPSDTALGRIQEVPTIHKLTDAQGKERLFIFTGLYPVRMAISEDSGESWSSFAAIGDWGGIVTMSDIIPIKNKSADPGYAPGKYVAVFHDDGRFFKGSGKAHVNPKKFTVYRSLTNDGGLTWSSPQVIREDTVRLICEPGIIRSPDGKELAMLLRENSRRHYSQVMFSADEGETWSAPKPVHAALTGDRHVLRYAADGRVVAVFRDYQPGKATGPTEGDFVAWVGHYDDIRNGTPGQYRIRLLDNYAGYDGGYAGFEVFSDGSFLATTYIQYRPEDFGNNSVIAVRFTLKESDKRVLPGQSLIR